MKRYVLSVLVDNHAGVLSRVSGLFSRRGYNIDSLVVGKRIIRSLAHDYSCSRRSVYIGTNRKTAVQTR